MTRLERLLFLNKILLNEMPRYREEADAFPKTVHAQRRLLRSLMNVRPAGEISQDFLSEQDILLQEEATEKGIVPISDLPTVADESSGDSASHEIPANKMILWQGDITRLAADGIVNAANSALLGCFVPCHACIDNAIHSAAGLQLRQECNDVLRGGEIATGGAIITQGYNLPAKYVIHTVGPIVPTGIPTIEQELQLAQCYRNSIGLAIENGCRSIAFCCISTGEFRFPNRRAAEIAIDVVKEYTTSYALTHSHNNAFTVVFNVFKDIDYAIYRQLLGKD